MRSHANENIGCDATSPCVLVLRGIRGRRGGNPALVPALHVKGLHSFSSLKQAEWEEEEEELSSDC